MSIFKENDERVVVPLWNKSSDAVYSPEIKALNPKHTPFDVVKTTPILYQEFLDKKEIGVAVDLLNTAFMEDMNNEAIEAADFILSGFELPQQIIELAKKTKGIILDRGDKEKEIDTQVRISTIRRWLKENPRDCLGWIDLSRYYTSLGEVNSAKKCMLIGMGLANGHRWVTRVATRFFYNIEEFDRAHHILIKHPNINNDPWLISAELAVSSSYGRPIKLWSQAKKVIESGLSQYHISELQSSVGTLELMNGTIKKAKKLFINSLTSPNSNILAQAKWVERTSDIKGLVDQKTLREQKKAFEAKCWEAYADQDMISALCFCKKWIEQEPYALDPFILASFIASLLDNYKEANDISKDGLRIDPNSATLQLNVIFSQISLIEINEGELTKTIIEDAFSKIKSIMKNDDKAIVAHACANLGLVFYKTGDIYKGKEWYQKSIDIFKTNKHPAYVLAELNHLREALISKSPWAHEQFNELEAKIKTGGVWSDPSVHYYLKKLNAVKNDIDNWRVHLLDNGKLKNHDNEGQEGQEGQEKNNEKQKIKFDFSPESPTIWILPNDKKE